MLSLPVALPSSWIVALAFLLSLGRVSGLWVLTDQTIRVTLEGSARKAVDVDLAGLADIHASSGREELERRIRDRLAITPVDGAAPHYLLADANGARIVGDIAAWPQLDAAISETGTIRVRPGTTTYIGSASYKERGGRKCE